MNSFEKASSEAGLLLVSQKNVADSGAKPLLLDTLDEAKLPTSLIKEFEKEEIRHKDEEEKRSSTTHSEWIAQNLQAQLNPTGPSSLGASGEVAGKPILQQGESAKNLSPGPVQAAAVTKSLEPSTSIQVSPSGPLSERSLAKPPKLPKSQPFIDSLSNHSKLKTLSSLQTQLSGTKATEAMLEGAGQSSNLPSSVGNSGPSQIQADPLALSHSQIREGEFSFNPTGAGSAIHSGLVKPSLLKSSNSINLDQIPSSTQTGLSGRDFINTLQAARGETDFSGGLDQESALRSGMQKLEKPKKPNFDGLANSAAEDHRFNPTDTAQALGTTLSSLGAGPSQNSSAVPHEISAYPVPGGNAELRLSHESVANMANSIRTLSTQGGGEIRIRLKPEHLGDLSLRVMTNGAHVGLQIQTSDEKVRKMIEQSVESLRESLSAQKLSLSQLDLTVRTFSGDSGADMRRDSSQPSWQPTAQDGFRQDTPQNHQGGAQQWFGSDLDSLPVRPGSGRPAVGLSALGAQLAVSRDRSTRSEGRLDVRA